jgi:hypothetical protein
MAATNEDTDVLTSSFYHKEPRTQIAVAYKELLSESGGSASDISAKRLELESRIKGDYVKLNCHFVVEVLGFAAIWICRSMSAFGRNMMSPSSGG